MKIVTSRHGLNYCGRCPYLIEVYYEYSDSYHKYCNKFKRVLVCADWSICRCAECRSIPEKDVNVEKDTINPNESTEVIWLKHNTTSLTKLEKIIEDELSSSKQKPKSATSFLTDKIKRLETEIKELKKGQKIEVTDYTDIMKPYTPKEFMSRKRSIAVEDVVVQIALTSDDPNVEEQVVIEGLQERFGASDLEAKSAIKCAENIGAIKRKGSLLHVVRISMRSTMATF